MKKFRLVLAFAGLFAMSTAVHAQYADAVLSYEPGAGFAAGYTNASSALGAPALGSSVNPMSPPFSKSQLVSIGAGGETTLQLDSPITDNPSDPFGLDFIIFGNSFFIGNGGSGQNETTSGSLFYHQATAAIQVSADDVNWYTLNPALAPQPGEWFPSYGGGNPQIAVNPALAATDFAGMTLGNIESLYDGSAGGAGYSLAWAQDADGDSINLASADYVRIDVQSGVVDMDALSVVPEPSVWALLVAGGTFLFFCGHNSKSNSLKIMRLPLLLLASLLALSSARAADFTETFTNDPAQNGWQIFGDTNLFQWDSTNHVMNVTWDTSQPNSYFYHPLGTTLCLPDAFTVSFDLQLANIEWQYYPALSVGLFNLGAATNGNFSRVNVTTPNLFEFDYYPDSGDLNDDPSVTATLADMTVSPTNENGFYFIFDDLPMNLGTTYRVTLSHSYGERGLTAMISQNGQVYATMTNVYSGPISDFRLDAVSISSYEDDYDPLLAQGAVGNVTVALPPAGRSLLFQCTNGVAQLEFGTYPGWTYTLESSTNLESWADTAPGIPGDGNVFILNDTNAAATTRFYRVRATQPQ